jgi:hypothetical protein
MIQVQLSPEVEARIQAQARAQGIEMETYLKSLIENAVHATPIATPQSASARNMNAFFEAMAAHSDKIPELPDEAFTRESFYQDHD